MQTIQIWSFVSVATGGNIASNTFRNETYCGYEISCDRPDFDYSFPRVMKTLASWLLVVAVLFGLQLRVLAHDPCEVLATMTEDCHTGHPHENDAPCDSPHDKNCPSEHHHQGGACCHVLPLVSDNQAACRLASPASYRLRLRPERALIPEGPYLSSDRPPLI